MSMNYSKITFLAFFIYLLCPQINAQTVKTFAGQAGSGAGAVQTDTIINAKFNEPYGIAIDASGRIYISEQFGHRIRLYNPSEGNVYTRAGSPGDPNTGLTAAYLNGTSTATRFNTPMGIALDALGNLYVADAQNHCIRKITNFVSAGSGQVVTTYAGEAPGPGAGIGSYQNGVGTAARFDTPMDVAVNTDGVIYVADAFNACIRKIATDGTVSLLAGVPGVYGNDDGAATSAKFDLPVSVELLNSTTLLVADVANRNVRSINLTTNMVTTIAGSGSQGGDDGASMSATFASPNGLAVDAFNNVFIADGRNGQANTIRKISAGQVTTVAGKYNTQGTTDGQSTDARFDFPGQLAFNASKDLLYVTDVRNHTIRTIDLKPVADFSTFSTSINVNVEATLNNTSLNAPTSYLWEITPSAGVSFTSGTNATSASPKVTFTQSGSYTIKLTATNAYGSNVKTRNNYINVSNTGGGNAPIADFSADKIALSPQDTLFLTDKSTNNPIQWDWTITPSTVQYVGGTGASSQNPKVKFSQNGVYTVALKVTNPLGNNTKTNANYISVFPAGIKTVTLDELVNVYPNPTSGKLTVDLGQVPVNNTLTVAVFDMTGKAIYEDILFENPGSLSINLEGQPKGLYFVTVYDGINKVNKTVVVQ